MAACTHWRLQLESSPKSTGLTFSKVIPMNSRDFLIVLKPGRKWRIYVRWTQLSWVTHSSMGSDTGVVGPRRGRRLRYPAVFPIHFYDVDKLSLSKKRTIAYFSLVIQPRSSDNSTAFWVCPTFPHTPIVNLWTTFPEAANPLTVAPREVREQP